jgi:hypothetical protein
MNLQELFNQAMKDEPEARVRNTKTAVRTLAKALGYDTPASCPEEAFQRPLKQLCTVVEQQIAGKGPHTIRNTKNYLSHLFRKADTAGLILLTPELPPPKFNPRKRPPRAGAEACSHHGFSLAHRDWPAPLQQEWERYYHWASAPLAADRPSKWRKKPITLAGHLHLLEGYFGYLAHVRHLTNLHFDHLFDAQLVSDFVHWHVNELRGRPTRMMQRLVMFLIMLARQYRPSPEFREQMRELQRTLGRPTPVYDKQEAWVSLDELRRVALALWPKRRLEDLRTHRGTPGSMYAARAAHALILRLWCYIPLRSRNIREMKLGENLYLAEGKWMLRFKGEQLKIAQKKGKENLLALPFPPDLVPLLQEYLQTWRPLLCVRDPDTQIVFPSKESGKAFQKNGLNASIKESVYRYTGKPFHPHLIRTIWATEYIRTTGDFYGAAVMLNDRLETVVANYSHVMEHGIAEKAYAWVNKQFAGPTAPALPSSAVPLKKEAA